MSFVLCFSIFISSFNVCSFNLNFKSSSFCFSSVLLIFSNLSFSCFSNFILRASSFFIILYWSIVLAILSKKPWMYFSKLKFNFILNLGLIRFWKLIIFKIKLSSFFTLEREIFLIFLLLLTIFFLNLFFNLFLFFFLVLFFFTFFVKLLYFLLFLILTFFLIFFDFFFCFFHLKRIYIYQ